MEEQVEVIFRDVGKQITELCKVVRDQEKRIKYIEHQNIHLQERILDLNSNKYNLDNT